MLVFPTFTSTLNGHRNAAEMQGVLERGTGSEFLCVDDKACLVNVRHGLNVTRCT